MENIHDGLECFNLKFCIIFIRKDNCIYLLFKLDVFADITDIYDMDENIRLDKIPLEIIQQIVSHLNASSSLALLLVNKKVFTYFINDFFFWKHVISKLGLYVPKYNKEIYGTDYIVKMLKNSFQEWKNGKFNCIYLLFMYKNLI